MANEKVIIVDDEADVLELCERILTTQGFQVKTAQDGYEAVRMAEQNRFDLLLTDIKMPGMNGLEIAQALREADPGISCIIMTGFSTMDRVIEALKLGADEFIMKPFTPEELSVVINKALEKDQLRKENFRLRSLIPLFELNKTLMRTVEVEEVLQRLLEIARQETQADFACIYTFDQNKIVQFGHLPEHADNPAHQQTYDRLAQIIFKDGQELTFSRKQGGANSFEDILDQLEAQAVIAIPLKSQNTDLGALILVRQENDFAPSDSDFLAVLSGQVSIALENARLFTKIQEAYQELQTLDDLQSEFINIAAHELRTPLAVLMGYLTVLEEEVQEQQRGYLNNITRNAMRLRSLIDDMLNMQYLESGLVSLSEDSVNLNEMVAQLVQDMALMAGEKNLEIKVEIPEDFPEMVADRYKLDLIIMNLLHNAIKFTPEEGQVTFRAWTEGDQAVISVNNTGTVIPPAERERIFDRFYQIESSLTRQHGGIGLGLSIVRGMVEVCGGKIRVESDAENGTTFTFTIPLDNSHLEERLIKL